MERRNFLGALTAASLGVALEALSPYLQMRKALHGMAKVRSAKLPLRLRKSSFREIQSSCAATERDRPF